MKENNDISNQKKNNSNLIKLLLIILLIIINLLLLPITIFSVVRGSTHHPIIYNSGEDDLKPIIYFYPEEDTDITVTVDHPEKFTVTYPKYNDGWKVKALKDGTLIDKNNKKYYALYWEGKYKEPNMIKEDGFVIKGEDTAVFLEEKLNILGLNYKEANEFIMYWLPKLENNKYNYIRFQTIDEINNNMYLNINPKPNTLIRVRMEYKPLDRKISVMEQQLKNQQREGYTVVEWGGTEIIY